MNKADQAGFTINIHSWSAWLHGCSIVELKDWAQGTLALPVQPATWPAPRNVPKGQHRRLSPMAKMVLSLLDNVDSAAVLPSVFSTRHGDSSKTVALVADVANNEPLSPTQFALSVHNAIAGQFSIYWGNTQASNIVSGGKDSFHLGLLDAAVRLGNSSASKMLFIHADLPLPTPYEKYADEQQMGHCVVMVLSKTVSALSYRLKRLVCPQVKDSVLPLPQAVEFLRSMLNEQQAFRIQGDACWEWQRE